MASIAIRTILAGDETGVPRDSPFERLDVGNEYSFVGALSMQLGARTSSATGSPSLRNGFSQLLTMSISMMMVRRIPE